VVEILDRLIEDIEAIILVNTAPAKTLSTPHMPRTAD